MPESPDLFAEVANLRDQVDDLSRTVSAIARRSGAKEEILEAMDQDQVMARVFLLVDGKRTQGEIVEELTKQGVPTSQPTVSRKIDSLIEEWDLVRKTSRDRAGTAYVRTSLARDLRIARTLETKLKAKKPGSGANKNVKNG